MKQAMPISGERYATDTTTSLVDPCIVSTTTRYEAEYKCRGPPVNLATPKADSLRVNRAAVAITQSQVTSELRNFVHSQESLFFLPVLFSHFHLASIPLPLLFHRCMQIPRFCASLPCREWFVGKFCILKRDSNFVISLRLRRVN